MDIKERVIRLCWFAGFCLVVFILVMLVVYGFGKLIAEIALMLLLALVFHYILFGDNENGL